MRKALIICAMLLAPHGARAESAMTEFMEVMIPHMDQYVPEPTLAARGMALTFTAAYDAWAAYDDEAVGVVTGDLLDGTGGAATQSNIETAVLYAMITVQYGVTGKQNALWERLGQMGYRQINETDAAILGRRVGAAVLASRRQDGSNQPGQYDDTSHYMIAPVDDFRAWQPDIIDRMTQEPLTPHWGRVLPFALADAAHYRAPPPPTPGTPAFDAQVEELLAYSANLTEEQKAQAEYWAPERWANPSSHLIDISRDISMREHFTLEQDVKMFFIISNALMDAGIAAWDSKYHYNYVRPVTVIQRMGDEMITAYNYRTDQTEELLARRWEPYLDTPPFPEYVSGHSAFTAAWAQAMELFMGTDQLDYTGLVYFLSEESTNHVFDPIELHFQTYWEAAESSGMSRVYGGIHWMAGNREGLAMGQPIGRHAYMRAQDYFDGAAMSPTAVMASTDSQYWRPMGAHGRMSAVIDPMPVGRYAVSAQLAPMNEGTARGPARITIRAGDGSDRILGIYDESRRVNSGSPWVTLAWRSTGVEPFYLTIEPVEANEPFQIVQIYQVRVN